MDGVVSESLVIQEDIITFISNLLMQMKQFQFDIAVHWDYVQYWVNANQMLEIQDVIQC